MVEISELEELVQKTGEDWVKEAPRIEEIEQDEEHNKKVEGDVYNLGNKTLGATRYLMHLWSPFSGGLSWYIAMAATFGLGIMAGAALIFTSVPGKSDSTGAAAILDEKAED